VHNGNDSDVIAFDPVKNGIGKSVCQTAASLSVDLFPRMWVLADLLDNDLDFVEQLAS